MVFVRVVGLVGVDCGGGNDSIVQQSLDPFKIIFDLHSSSLPFSFAL